MKAIVLAGGRSRRMGRDKGLLMFEGVALARRAIEALTPIASDGILLVANDAAYAGLGAPLVGDIFPGRGPLAGIHAGLLASAAAQNFVVACDMPFLNPALALHLAALASGHDAAVPLAPDRPQPLHAVYDRCCLPVIEEQLRAGQGSLQDLLARLDVRWVKTAEILPFGDPARIFFNVNDPRDLDRARSFSMNNE